MSCEPGERATRESLCVLRERAQSQTACFTLIKHCHTCDDITVRFTHGHAHPTPTAYPDGCRLAMQRLTSQTTLARCPRWRPLSSPDCWPTPAHPARRLRCLRISQHILCRHQHSVLCARCSTAGHACIPSPKGGSTHALCSGAAPSLPSGRCGRSPAMMMTHAMPDSRRMRHAHSQPRNSMTRAHTHTHGRSGNSARVSSHHHLAVPLLPPSIHLHVPRCGPLHALSRGVAH